MQTLYHTTDQLTASRDTEFQHQHQQVTHYSVQIGENYVAEVSVSVAHHHHQQHHKFMFTRSNTGQLYITGHLLQHGSKQQEQQEQEQQEPLNSSEKTKKKSKSKLFSMLSYNSKWVLILEFVKHKL